MCWFWPTGKPTKHQWTTFVKECTVCVTMEGRALCLLGCDLLLRSTKTHEFERIQAPVMTLVTLVSYISSQNSIAGDLKSGSTPSWMKTPSDSFPKSSSSTQSSPNSLSCPAFACSPCATIERSVSP